MAVEKDTPLFNGLEIKPEIGRKKSVYEFNKLTNRSDKSKTFEIF